MTEICSRTAYQDHQAGKSVVSHKLLSFSKDTTEWCELVLN